METCTQRLMPGWAPGPRWILSRKLKLAGALLLTELFIQVGRTQPALYAEYFDDVFGVLVTSADGANPPESVYGPDLTPGLPYNFNSTLNYTTKSGGGTCQVSGSIQITANSISASGNCSSYSIDNLNTNNEFVNQVGPAAEGVVVFSVPDCSYTLTGNLLVSGSETLPPPPFGSAGNSYFYGTLSLDGPGFPYYTGPSVSMSLNPNATGSLSQSTGISTSGFLPGGSYTFTLGTGTTTESLYGGLAQAASSANLTLTVYPIDPNCIFALSDPEPVEFDQDGGSNYIMVTSANGTNCTWTATSDSDWLTITSGSVYSGSGTVSFMASANCGTNRTGTLTIAGQPVTVNQQGVFLEGRFYLFDASGGTNDVEVITGSNCTWTASSDSGWLTIISGASGQGSSTLIYAATTNDTCSFRTGTLAVAGQSFVVEQLEDTNGYSLDAANALVDAGESSESVNVIAPTSGCSWTAVSDLNWITITSGSSGTGNGTVTYEVEANDTLTERVGELTIAGIDFTVTQAAGTCGFTLDPEYAEYGYSGASDSVDVQCDLDDNCPWTASSGVPWITITSGSTGNGDGTVYYTVAANTSVNLRYGSLTVADRTYQVEQDGVSACTYAVSPTKASYDSGAEGGAVSVTTDDDCSWTASANASWLSISSGNSGTGNDTVGYAIAANTTTNWRSGTLTVAGRTVTVNQAGLSNCTYSITVSPSPSNGGTTTGGGTVGCGSNMTVTATASSGYSFINWISGGTNVSTSAHYTFLANNDASLTANFATGPIIITTSPLPDGALGTVYSQIIQAANGTPAYSWSVVSNGLPAGLSLGSGSGAIIGTPTTVTITNFTVEVTDSNQLSATQSFSLTTSIVPLQITSTTLPGATQNVFYSTSLGASGGHPPYAWSLAPGSASLPSSLSLSTNGLISGIPASSGNSNFMARVRDSASNSVQQLLALTVIAPISPSPLLITAPVWNGGGQFQFNLNTASNVNYTIQSSADLKNWTSILTISGIGGQETIQNLTVGNGGPMFFRAEIGP
jgi:Putative Ig domain/Divergent InlB B-repeat domain/Putative binding domain, N-terminal/Viral BACON domain